MLIKAAQHLKSMKEVIPSLIIFLIGKNLPITDALSMKSLFAWKFLNPSFSLSKLYSAANRVIGKTKVK